MLTGAVARVEPVKRLAEGLLKRVVQGSTGGPTPQARARTRSWAVAEAFDDTGRVLASVTLAGGDPYDFTGAILAWGAQTALDSGLSATGASVPSTRSASTPSPQARRTRASAGNGLLRTHIPRPRNSEAAGRVDPALVRDGLPG